ncbi:MAG TPA: hypothetical protein VGM90_14570 [Kofleriaceae bacterium]|jgi:hypothetical protein
MRTTTVALLAVAALAGCKGKAALINKLSSGSAESDSPVANDQPEQDDDSDEARAKRVAAVFPNGPATEHFEPTVKLSSLPPAAVIDPADGWVLELSLHTPLTITQISDALDPLPTTTSTVTTGARQGDGAWIDVTLEDSLPESTTFDRVAVELPFVAPDGPLTAKDIAEVSTWIGRSNTKLNAGTAVPSIKAEAALVRAQKVAAVLKSVEDTSDMVLTISRADGAPIPLRLAWDAMYSAGYVWAGDLMQWIPSEGFHGLYSFTGTDSGLWTPEDANDPMATTEDIHIHFSIPVNAQPERMLDVLVQQARYIAKRVGGQVIDNETDRPVNERLLRQRVAGQLKILTNAGLSPGSPLVTGYFY